MSNSDSTVFQQENSLINATFDAALFDILLLGLYTAAFFWAVYVFATSKKQNDYRVVTNIIILYLGNIAVAGVNWFFVRSFLGTGPIIDEDLYHYATSPPTWIIIFQDAYSLILPTVANSLFMGRCYSLWNFSRAALVLPSLLLVTQLILFSIEIRLDVLASLSSSLSLDPATVDVYTAALWTSFACSLITGCLISFRLQSLPRKPNAKRSPFSTFTDFFIQSGFMLSVVLFIFATINSMTISVKTFSSYVPVGDALHFAFSLFPVFSGMAPTLMVAHVIRLENAAAPTLDLATFLAATGQGIPLTNRNDTQKPPNHPVVPAMLMNTNNSNAFNQRDAKLQDAHAPTAGGLYPHPMTMPVTQIQALVPA